MVVAEIVVLKEQEETSPDIILEILQLYFSEWQTALERCVHISFFLYRYEHIYMWEVKVCTYNPEINIGKGCLSKINFNLLAYYDAKIRWTVDKPCKKYFF